MRILINTVSTKKHSGGAYQIAFNFVKKALEHPEIEWIYVVSKDLDEILPDEVKGMANYHVYPTQPDFKHSYRSVKKALRELERRERPDVVYSITAPSYFSFETKEVMRFTNPWVTHPNKYSWASLSLRDKLETWFYCWLQRRLMSKAHYFVTQTETTKQGIVRVTGVPAENACVVSNVLPAAFAQLDSSHITEEKQWVDVACVGAPVPHKNFDIIPKTLIELHKLGIDNLRFQVTIPKDLPIWKRISEELKENGMDDRVVNHGRMSQAQMADMYRRCSLCFLPTLLEVFSASTLEAMFYDLKIVATDFGFNREVLGDASLYYEPMNAADAARQFARLLSDKALQENLSKEMTIRLAKYDDYDKHFNSIVDFLKKVALKEIK